MKKIGKMSMTLLAAFFLCVSCGKGLLSTSMKLAKTEGDVTVLDERKQNLEPAEDMGLYSGYQVSTLPKSYSWIRLDNAKLAKMDENSEIEIRKLGRYLEVLVHSGSFYFHVTEPLKDNESMIIRTSNMAVGIRGTCGWAEAVTPECMLVHILEGTVECTVTEPDSGEVKTQAVSGGETARLTLKDGQGEITISKFTEEDIPSFVMEELQEDNDLYREVTDILAGRTPLQPEDISGSENGDTPSASSEADPDDSQESRPDSAEDSDGSREPDPEGENPESADSLAQRNGLTLIRTNTEEMNCLNGAGGVLITYQNEQYGAVNYDKESIVPNLYPMYYMFPNEEGQFVLGDQEEACVFDKEGNILLTVDRPYDSWSVFVSEGTVVYGHLDENNVPEVCCYDLDTGSYLLQRKMDDYTDRDKDLMPYFGVKVSPMADGVFYYSASEGNLYQVSRDGSTVQIDERWEQSYEEGDLAEGAVSFRPYARNWPAYAARDGFLACYAWDVYLHTLFNCNTGDWYTFGVELEEEYVFYSEAIHYYFSNGTAYGNRGMQIVITDENKRYYLMDFSRAKTNERGIVVNMPDVILAEYDYICQCGEGYCYAEENGRQFYLDENGSPITSFQPVKCSSFYDGYAAIIAEDGLGYIIDKDFHKITDGYPAESVYQACGLLCMKNGNEKIFFSIPR